MERSTTVAIDSTSRPCAAPSDDGLRSDRGFRFRGAACDEALARLHFLVEQQRRLGVLCGRAGTGKTLLLDAFAGELRRSGRAVASVNLHGIGPAELMSSLAVDLGSNPDRQLSVPMLWRMVSDRLAEHGYQKIDTVLLLDDADRAGEDVLVQVTRLVQHESRPRSRLTIVLGSRKEPIAWLPDDLVDLVDLRIELEPWDREESEAYLQGVLERSGRDRSLFSSPAIDHLHELTGGLPRRVHRLTGLCLLAAAGSGQDWIDAETVESVWRELVGYEGGETWDLGLLTP